MTSTFGPVTVVTGGGRGIGAATVRHLAGLGHAVVLGTRVLPRIPMGRVGEPAEIAPAIAWLLGPEAGYVTGASIRVAGGL